MAIRRADTHEEWLNELLTTFRARPSILDPVPESSPFFSTQPVLPITEPVVNEPARSSRATAITVRSSGRSRSPIQVPSKVIFRLCRFTLASALLSHCFGIIEEVLGRGLTVFKLGVTTNANYRWFGPAGYARDPDRYQELIVFAKLATSEAAGILEAVLIDRFRTTAGCRNIAGGGEGIKKHADEFFLYIVYKTLPTPPPRT